ncbi:MAG: hypothetical protein IJQ73_15935 [Kiritimatiellae bacterium]|nr:hypothetical protein [Kiritimatiellia bacterium]
MRAFIQFVAIALLALPVLADGKDGDVEFRDPFWPVGYSPAKEEPPKPQKVEPVKPVAQEKKPEAPPPPPEPEPDWRAAMRLLRISGYAESGGRRTCVINGQTVSESEKISIVHDGFRYTWRLDQIAPLKSQMRFTRLAVTRLSSN